MKGEWKLCPVKVYRKPGYPVQEAVQAEPELLSATPRRWHAKPVVCALLAFTLSSGLSACGSIEPKETPGAETPFVSDPPEGANASPAVLKIPVFDRGPGAVSYGCVSVAPPVYLSEDEALEAIRQEAATMGVDFSGTAEIRAELPVTSKYARIDETRQGTLELDGYDKALGIGFELITQEDVKAWLADKSDVYSSVDSYDMKGTAERLAENVENVAVFYAPSADFSEFQFPGEGEDYNEYVETFSMEQREKMMERLREQVRDFLAWLAAQGVI